MRTSPRRLLVISVAAVTAVLPVWAWALWPETSAITRASFEQIQVGMTLAEVEGILSGPARDESTGYIVAVPRHDDNPRESRLGVFLAFGDQVPRRKRLAKHWKSNGCS